MMYENKLVVAILANGKVLREHKDTVYLPFGIQYTLRFKNLNSLRALVRVEIDGTDATQGTSLIIPANGTVDLERFLKAGDGNVGHRFKFIERTQKIEDGPRGIKAEDGLIRVEFEFERQPAKIEYETIKRTYVDEYWRTRPYPIWNGPWYSTSTTLTSTAGDATEKEVKTSGVFRGVTSNSAKLGSAAASAGAAEGMAVAYNAASSSPQAFVNQVQSVAGITVPGSISEQKFQVGQWFPTDGQKHVMVLKLMGRVGEAEVEKPVTVKTKVECPTCGTTNKFGTKFCGECGTGLALL